MTHGKGVNEHCNVMNKKSPCKYTNIFGREFGFTQFCEKICCAKGAGYSILLACSGLIRFTTGATNNSLLLVVIAANENIHFLFQTFLRVQILIKIVCLIMTLYNFCNLDKINGTYLSFVVEIVVIFR